MSKHPYILQLDESGTPSDWCDWQTALCYKAKDMIVWSLGDISFDFKGGNSRLTGERTEVSIPSIIAVRSQAKSGKYTRKVPTLTNSNLFRRDLFTCAYCGKIYREEKLTRDHIHPVSKGGKNTWMNTITACKPCNNYKGSYLLADIGMELRFAPYVPTRAENMLLANRTILTDQMDFLKNCIPEKSRAHLIRS